MWIAYGGHRGIRVGASIVVLIVTDRHDGSRRRKRGRGRRTPLAAAVAPYIFWGRDWHFVTRQFVLYSTSNSVVI